MSPAGNPLHVPVHDLGRRPGASREVVATVPAPQGVGTDVMGVPTGSDLDLDLRLDSVSDGVFVTGTVAARAVGQCGRCLDPLDEIVSVDVDEMLFYPERRAALLEEGDEEMIDAPVVESEVIDLEPIVRDAVVLGLPFQPLCRPGCPGLCDVCGERWDELPDDHHHELLDPRWAALAALSSAGADPDDSAAGNDDVEGGKLAEREDDAESENASDAGRGEGGA